MTNRTSVAERVRRRSPVALALGVLVGLLAGVLSGCSALGTPGAAAVVDGRSVSESDVLVATGELRSFLGEDGVTTQAVVYLAVITEPVAVLAADRGISISADQAQEAWLESRERVDGEAVTELSPVTAEILATVEMFNLLVQDDQAAAQLRERVGELDLEINPRYGTIDESTPERQLIPAVPEWQRPGG